MSLSESSLSGKLQTELQNIMGSAGDNNQLSDFCDAIAKAVVDEITSNAIVSTSVPNIQNGSSVAAGTGTVS